MAGKKVTGGAVVEQVEVQENTAPASEGPTVEVITTAPGTFGTLGIVKVGTRHTIPEAMFSAKWMRKVSATE